MNRQLASWYSQALQKEMPIVSYGYSGFVLLLVPTAAADYLEYERFQLIQSLATQIHAGKLRMFSINSIINESWMNNEMLPEHKAIRHNDFNHYVFNETIPYIRNIVGSNTMIYTSGASFGALHSMNLFLKRPDIINGCICMSGVYDLTEYTKGFWDEQVYYNSPAHYIPNLNNEWYVDKIKASRNIHIYTGSGNYEAPDANKRFSQILWDKGIWHDIDIWGGDIHHDWSTWCKMLPYIIDTKF